MDLKSVSSLVMYVDNLGATVKFYETLGFDFKHQDETMASGYKNWFKIDFLLSSSEQKDEFLDEANAKPKGGGIYIYLSVGDVDAAYAELIKKGLTPSSEPRDWPWGNREFVIRDPDGYKLVLFKKK